MKLALLLLLTCLALLMATEGARLTRFKGRDRGELRRKTNNNDYDADADANSDVNDDNDANGDDYNDGTRSRGALARSRTRTRDRNRDSLQQTDAAYNAVTFGIQLRPTSLNQPLEIHVSCLNFLTNFLRRLTSP